MGLVGNFKLVLDDSSANRNRVRTVNAIGVSQRRRLLGDFLSGFGLHVHPIYNTQEKKAIPYQTIGWNRFYTKGVNFTANRHVGVVLPLPQRAQPALCQRAPQSQVLELVPASEDSLPASEELLP